jgi:ADP-heptose:LPS heptosyltransferase
LKTSRFEQVYDLSGNDSARRLKAALGPFGPKWFSAEPAGKPAKGAPPEPPSLEKLAASAGLSIENKLPDLSWAVTARKDSANMQPSWYGISGPFGLLLPGETESGRWTAAGYAGLAREMARAGIMPVLAGSKSLHNFGDEIAHEAPQLVDLTGKTDHLQLAALAQEAAFFVSDCAEELQLALSVGCEGVVICSAKQPFSAGGRHIVTMTAPPERGGGLTDVDPVFVWRTLNNMGLVDHGHGAPRTAQIR